MTARAELGRWIRVDARDRCSSCGHMVDATWRWFESGSTFTHAWCDDCVAAKLAEADS